MSRRFILPPLVIFGAILFLAAGELAAGTGLFFVAGMSVAMLAIGITYNTLGGLGTIGGLVFTSFALNTLVISQFAKVLLFEPADKHLGAPELTIAVYAAYYLALMVGVFLFAWIRLDLPRPLEPVTSTHSNVMYVTAFIIGLAATVYVTAQALKNPLAAQGSTEHGLGRAFAALLPLSLVLAVDGRIRKTKGRHSFGWSALWPLLAMEFFGFLDASRSNYLKAPMIVLVTCYFRGVPFRKRHYLAIGGLIAGLVLFFFPYYAWARAWRHQSDIKQETTTMWRLLVSAPQHWTQIEAASHELVIRADREGNQYFSRPGTYMLNRFSEIQPDSQLIRACARFHYGLKAFVLDVESSAPHFIVKDQPELNGAWYRASISGLQSSYQGNDWIAMSIIPDAFGSFGWWSLILVPLLLVPTTYVVFDSMFDMSKPWGTVITVTLIFLTVGSSVGQLVVTSLLEIPIYTLLVSWFFGWITRYASLRGDRALPRSAEWPEPENAGSIAGI